MTESNTEERISQHTDVLEWAFSRCEKVLCQSEPWTPVPDKSGGYRPPADLKFHIVADCGHVHRTREAAKKCRKFDDMREGSFPSKPATAVPPVPQTKPATAVPPVQVAPVKQDFEPWREIILEVCRREGSDPGEL